MRIIKLSITIVFLLTLKQGLARDKQIAAIDSMTDYCRTITYSEPIKAMGVIEDIFSYSRQAEYARGLGDAHNLRGILYFNWGLYDMALRDFLDAMHAFAICNDYGGLSRALNNLGVLASTISQYRLSLLCFRASLSIQIHYKQWENVADLYNNIGSMCERIGDTSFARKYAFKAISVSKAHDYQLGVATAYNNLGVIDENAGRLDMAIYWYNLSLSLKEIIPRHQLCLTYSNLGRIEFLNGQKERALLWLDSASLYGEVDNDQQLLEPLYKQFAEVYASMGDYIKAYRYIIRYIDINTKLNEQNVGRDFANFTFVMQREQWNNERTLLAEKVQLQHRLQLVLIIGLIILLVLIAMGLILARNRMRLLHQSRKLAELERETLQREVLSRDTIARLEKENLEAELSYRNRQLTSLSMNIVSKQETLQEISRNLDNILDNDDALRATDGFSRLNSILKMNSDDDAIWKSFFHHFEEVYPGFFAKLSSAFPQLTHSDLRLASYIHINMGNKEIARIIGISEASVKIKKNRLGKKIGIESANLLPQFLHTLMNKNDLPVK